jgi:hypothetical protein
MPGHAVPRSPEDQALIQKDPTALFQKKLDANPNFKLPNAWERADDGKGRVVAKGMDNWQKLAKALTYSAAGIGAYGGGALIAPYLAGAGGGVTGGAMASALPGTTAGGTLSAVAPTVAGAGGSGMWGTILKAALPLIMGQISGKMSKNAANQASGGARLQDLMPLLMPLILQSQQHANTGYQQQTDQYNKVQPLQDQILRNAQRMTPRGY